MSVKDALDLMLCFGMFVIALLTASDNRKK
ncbi:putative holin-like toxin [Lapidilactobacillus gannanensis]|uniref:Holin-like toxin n=1 Tax=Lapidilactobacillus gannanensis TaxID=2486002 RepID=A0ABW4BL12_9LACO